MPISLNQVPPDIREHFGSEQTTALVSEISAKADLVMVELLPRLLYLLEIKEVGAADLIDEIAKRTGTDKEKAKAVAKEIKDKILEPKRYALSQWGVDVKLINTEGARPLSDFTPKQMPTEQKTISLESIGQRIQITEETPAPAQASASVQTLTPETKSFPAPTDETKPLILHQEKPLTDETIKRSGGKAFSFPFQFFKPGEPAEPQKPVTAKIETLGSELAETARKQEPPTLRMETPQKRIVDYSKFRTPLSPFGKEKEEMINLEGLGQTDQTTPPAPAPAQT